MLRLTVQTRGEILSPLFSLTPGLFQSFQGTHLHSAEPVP